MCDVVGKGEWMKGHDLPLYLSPSENTHTRKLENNSYEMAGKDATTQIKWVYMKLSKTMKIVIL